MINNQWIIYAFTVFISAMIPGPSMILAMTHGAKYGISTSVITAFGNVFVSVLQVIAAALLVLLISMNIEASLLILQIAGGIYLAWLGYRIIRL